MLRDIGALLLVTVLFSPRAWAHRDRIFPITASGAIEGIAQRFGPVSITVRSDAGQPAVTFRVKTPAWNLLPRETRLPTCLARLFVLPPGQEMTAHGSWWHRSSSLPPYIVFDLPQAGSRAAQTFEGYSMMFNLRTAELMKVVQEDESAYVAVDLAALCSRLEVDALRFRPIDSDRGGC